MASQKLSKRNGGLAVKEIDACFDFFELSAPPPK
jgi:hypothetical protein